jgi:hypothetical protein
VLLLKLLLLQYGVLQALLAAALGLSSPAAAVVAAAAAAAAAAADGCTAGAACVSMEANA